MGDRMSQEQILEALAALSAEVAGDVREELLVMGGAASRDAS
jgi:hypothetical protein